MIARKYLAYRIGNNLFGYHNGKWGIIEDTIENEIKKWIQFSYSIEKKNRVMDFVRKHAYEIDRMPNPDLVIVFQNAIYHWEYDRVYSISPYFYYRNTIPHDLDVEFFNKYIHENKKDVTGLYDIEKIMNDEMPSILGIFKSWSNQWKTLIEIIGYTLYPRYILHKAFMLHGSGSNGKTTYLRLLNDILGENNVSSISLQEISERPFSRVPLHNKLANIFSDIPAQPLKYTGYFKVLTGEDSISADRKNRDYIICKLCKTNL